MLSCFRWCFLCSLFILPLLGLAQNPESKFGKVSTGDLQLSVYPLDSIAAAVVLSDIGKTKFIYTPSQGVQLEFTRHTRIKILSAAGYDWANVEIPLYRDGSNKEEVAQLKGITYNLVDGKIEKDKLRREHKFSENHSEHYDLYKFTMPSVREGSVLEYEYTVVSDFLFNLQDWKFQWPIPVVWSEYSLAIPEYYQYKQLMQGYHPLAVNESSRKADYFVVTYKVDHDPASMVNQRETRTQKINFQADVYRWAAQQVPALVEEPFVTTLNDYVSKISFELAYVNFPGQMMENFTTTWKEIDEELLHLKDFGGLLKANHNLKKKARDLTTLLDQPSEKLEVVYSFMRDSLRWNGENGVLASQSSNKTLEDKQGNAADINLTLIAMLRAIDVQAYPVVLSTRDHGMIRQSFPMLSQYNYTVGVALLDGQTFLLDATEPNCPLNLLPERCLNGIGRLVSEDFADRWIDLNATTPAARFTMANVSLTDQYQLKSQINTQYSNYLALNLRNKFADHQVEDRKAHLLARHEGGELQQYAHSQWLDVNQPLKETYEVLLQHQVVQAGEMIYIDPVLVGKLEENPFQRTERSFPVDFAYPSHTTYMMNLTVPEGYQVEEVPENLMLALPEQSGVYSCQVQQVGRVLQFVHKLEMNKSRYYAQEYPFLRAFFQQIVAKQAEPLVLRKIKKTE